MEAEFLNHLRHACRVMPSMRILLAVSGGIDSVVMTKLFQSFPCETAWAHCNFCLREAESDADEAFVAGLARSLSIRLYSRRFDTRAFAVEKGISIQMAARELRLSWFHDLCLNEKFDRVALAHHANDQVETMLINLSRGTGLRGLTGMKALSGLVIRPLLFASRSEISHWAKQHQLTWREDSSNLSAKYTRNRIRHLIIPELERINPSFLKTAIQMISRLQDTELLIDNWVGEVKQAICKISPGRMEIDIRGLVNYPAPEALLFELLREYGAHRLDIGELFHSVNAEPGKRFYTGSHSIVRDRTCFIVTPVKDNESVEMSIAEAAGTIGWPLPMHFTLKGRGEGFEIPRMPACAALDADRLSFPLKLRKWRRGDRFFPLGMDHPQKVSDFLINNKVALVDKDEVWVLESAGEIVWVVNRRIDNRYRVTGSTKRVFLAEYKPDCSETTMDS